MRRAWSSLAVVALALAMLVQFVVQQRADQVEADCRASFVIGLRANLDARSALSSASDDNQNRLILAVTSMVTAADGPPPTAVEAKRQNEKYRQGFVDFAREAARIEKLREANPVPPIPDC